jgi:hypothetical protein
MWEFIQSYGVWIILGIAALYLFAGGCGRGAGMGCGGHGTHSHRQGDRRPSRREREDEPDEEMVGSSPHEPRQRSY